MSNSVESQKNKKSLLANDVEKNNLKEVRRTHYHELTTLAPYESKIETAKIRIKEFLIWCEQQKYNEVLISFSGGKDSTVLLDLVLKVHKKMESKIYLVPSYAIEITFPETIKFIKDTIENYREDYPYLKQPLLVPPKMSWSKILKTKGFPIFSKQVSVMINRLKNANTNNNLTKWAFGITESARFKLSKNRLFLLDEDLTYYLDENGNKVQYDFSEKCCDYVKGGLKHDYRPSFVGTMADESLLRKKSWIDNGCNVFNNKHPISRPLSLWNFNDVWKYIKENDLDINQVYGYDKQTHNIDNLRFNRLGCSACPFGSTFEEVIHRRFSKEDLLSTDKRHWNRFEKLYEYNNILYKSQVIQTKMIYILIDMDIKVRNDPYYMQVYYERRKRIDDWYKNFRENLIKIMIRIETSNKNKNGWRYSLADFNKALLHFQVDKLISEEELETLRNKYSITKNN